MVLILKRYSGSGIIKLFMLIRIPKMRPYAQLIPVLILMSALPAVKTYLEMALPSANLDFLMSEINQSDTFLSLEVPIRTLHISGVLREREYLIMKIPCSLGKP